MAELAIIQICSDVKSDIVITGRDVEALEGTRKLITSQAPGVTVHIVSGDLGDMKNLPALCSKLLEPADSTRHKQSLLVNNAGTLSDCNTPILSQIDPETIQQHFDCNVTSMIILTTKFLSALPSSPQFVVNITSKLASVFKPGFQLCSPSRAARNAFMGVLGAEIPSVRHLSYSPGACDTDMYRAVPEKFRTSAKHVLKPEVSIRRLVGILKENSFENGSTIDYHD